MRSWRSTSTRRSRRKRWRGSTPCLTWPRRSTWIASRNHHPPRGFGTAQPCRTHSHGRYGAKRTFFTAMIESFKHLEEVGAQRDLADVFLEVDAQEHGVPDEEIVATLRKRREVMRDCVERGKSGGLSMGKLVGNEAKKLNEAFAAGKTFLDPLTIKAELYALAVMGENSRMGVIVAAPTAGAGGVVPGMLLALEEERHVDPEKTVRALVGAGGVGSIIALSANISGAAGGCQNEVGVASSMGAAAVAYMMGGTARQSIHAAALALKNTLGLGSDPVGGLVEVPCVKRNALFAVHGLTAAQLALAGVESVIPD